MGYHCRKKNLVLYLRADYLKRYITHNFKSYAGNLKVLLTYVVQTPFVCKLVKFYIDKRVGSWALMYI